MTDADHWRHETDTIRQIQHAHAAHIESEYRDWAKSPGRDDPDIRIVSGVQTYCRGGMETFHNRAILTGDESAEQLDAVMQHYVEAERACWVEITPANFYEEGSSWDSKVLPHLLHRGFTIHGLRSIWMRDSPLTPAELDFGLDCRRVELSEFETSKVAGGEQDPDQVADIEAAPEFHYYVGTIDDHPVAWVVLWCNGEFGYLKQANTAEHARRQGFHSQLIRMRTHDAFGMGARLVFTHTAHGDGQSARNLQRNGLRIAYNYLLMSREPKPLS
ncbi:MAG: hypothetical protein QGI83_05620 [Candidatus Latescibacteria bacterium]|nr:hypothetical protein [Candidatus Latescibacterota bacterium]